MKKAFMPLILLIALALGGCRSMVPEDDQITVYASFYPIYALVGGVCEGVPNVTLRCLTQPQDGCLRAYQLSAWDAALMWDADALLIGGRGLESFSEALEESEVPVFSLLNGLELISEPSSDDESHWTGENPWLWLDPAGAADICREVYNTMARLDPNRAGEYADNLAGMVQRLGDLADDMRVPQGGRVAVMHEGFCYLARAMNLNVCASLERESGETVDADRLASAIAQFRDAGAQAVLIEAQAPQSLLRALADAGFSVALMDPLTAHNEQSPDAYFDIMSNNAREVKRALN